MIIYLQSFSVIFLMFRLHGPVFLRQENTCPNVQAEQQQKGAKGKRKNKFKKRTKRGEERGREGERERIKLMKKHLAPGWTFTWNYSSTSPILFPEFAQINTHTQLV